MTSIHRLGVLISIVGILLSGSAGAGQLSIATGAWVGFGPLYLARDLGYFKARGLDVTLIETGAAESMIAAMASGQISGSCSTVETMVRVQTTDVCFKAVVVLDDSAGADGILTAEDVTDIAQLKGKTIALHEGTSSELLLRYLAQKEGMAETDFTIVNMREDDAAAAFIADRVPAAVTFAPHLTFVQKSHRGKLLYDSSRAPGLIVDAVVLRCDVIQAQPQDVQALVAGLFQADDFVRERPTEAYDIMRKYVGGYLGTVADFAVAAQGVHYYGRDENLRSLGTDAAPGAVAQLLDVISGLEAPSVPKPSYAALVDPQFIH